MIYTVLSVIYTWEVKGIINIMGYWKQLHIDCTEDECIVNQPETCYMLSVNEEELEIGEV